MLKIEFSGWSGEQRIEMFLNCTGGDIAVGSKACR